VWLAMGVLLAQHLILFWPHYTGDATFYRDFTDIYYPLTAFWVSLLKEGIFPHWTPFANLGLPFILTMQSGIFYPPFWMFVGLDFLSYTLVAANVVAALHVLGGAFGAWCYARLLGMSIGAACFAAVAFQFMGCLYNNLQHPDIVRAYAYLPWVLWSVYLSPSARSLNARHFLLPLFLYLFVTSAYQGNLIAQSFVLTVLVLLSGMQAYALKLRASITTTRLYFQLLGLALLGLLMCSVYLWPTYQLLDYQARTLGVKDFRHHWHFSYWHTVIMPSHQDGIYAIQAMISAFITVPVFCLLFFINRGFLRREWLLIVITILSILLAAGRNTPFYGWLVDLFPMLGYSRLLSSDYRGLFCFGLILLAARLLDEYLQGKLSGYWVSRAGLCIGVLLSYLLFGWLQMEIQQLPPAVTQGLIEDHRWAVMVFYYVLNFFSRTITIFDPQHWLIALVLALLVWASLYIFRRRRDLLLSSIVGLTLVSGFWQWNMEREYWQLRPDMSKFYSGVNLQGPLPTTTMSLEPMEQRPACQRDATNPWHAYLLGKFACGVKDALNVKPRMLVDQSPLLYEYMIQPPRLVPLAETALSDCQPETLLKIYPPSDVIRQTSFGLQQIRYQVNSTKDFCFVENELFFPGWSGIMDGKPEKVSARPYCNALRAWCLPAGDYGFEAYYETPGLRTGFMASLLALAAYGGLLGFYGWRRFRL